MDQIAASPRFGFKWWIAPFALLAMAILLMLGLIVLGFLLGLVDDALGKPKWFDLIGLIVCLSAVPVLFGAMRGASREFYDDGGTARPRLRDHVRHAALLYLVAIALVAWAVITQPMDFFAVTAFLPLAALIGIVADYSVWRSRRRTGTESSGVI